MGAVFQNFKPQAERVAFEAVLGYSKIIEQEFEAALKDFDKERRELLKTLDRERIRNTELQRKINQINVAVNGDAAPESPMGQCSAPESLGECEGEQPPVETCRCRNCGVPI